MKQLRCPRAAASLLAGCGFHPLYGDASAGAAACLHLCRADAPSATAMSCATRLIDLLRLRRRDGGQALSPQDHAERNQPGHGAAERRHHHPLQRHAGRALHPDRRARAMSLTSGTQTGTVGLQRGARRPMPPWRRSRMPTSAPPRTSPSASSSIWASGSAQQQEMIVKSHEADRYRRQAAQGPGASRWSTAPMPGLVQERAEKLLKTRGARSHRSLQCRRSQRSRAAGRSGAAGRRSRRHLHDGRPAGGAGARRGQRPGRTVRIFPGRSDGRCAGGGRGGRSGQDRRPAQAVRRRTTTPPPSPAIPTPRATWPMWCAMRLRAEGLSIAPDALEDAVSRLGSDRGVTRREMEKLALYMHGQKQVSLEDVRAVMGDEAEARSESACDAAGSGDLRQAGPASWNGYGSRTPAGPGDAQRHGPFPAPAAGARKRGARRKPSTMR